jgi:hypothetical protein
MRSREELLAGVATINGERIGREATPPSGSRKVSRDAGGGTDERAGESGPPPAPKASPVQAPQESLQAFVKRRQSEISRGLEEVRDQICITRAQLDGLLLEESRWIDEWELVDGVASSLADRDGREKNG